MSTRLEEPAGVVVVVTVGGVLPSVAVNVVDEAADVVLKTEDVKRSAPESG